MITVPLKHVFILKHFTHCDSANNRLATIQNTVATGVYMMVCHNTIWHRFEIQYLQMTQNITQVPPKYEHLIELSAICKSCFPIDNSQENLSSVLSKMCKSSIPIRTHTTKWGWN